MADFKLPTLKRSLPKDKKARTEEIEGPVDLFPSDDEDDGIGFGDDSEEDEELEDLHEEDLDSDEEDEQKEPEKKKRKRDKNKNRKKKNKKAKKTSEGEQRAIEGENGVIGQDVKDTVVDFKVSKFK